MLCNPFKEVVGLSYHDNDSTSSCSLEAIYIYDAWGNHKVYNALGNLDTDQYSIGNLNPLRYKGYYFDKESGLYYLLSRYYDPSIGQFIQRMMRWGVTIVDYGIDISRVGRSVFYAMERELIMEYELAELMFFWGVFR